MHIFISQVSPSKGNEPSSSGPGDRLHPQTVQRLGQLVQTSRAVDLEATRLLQMGVFPFRGDREAVGSLRKGMREGLVLSSVRNSPGVQQAVGEVLERQRREKKAD